VIHAGIYYPPGSLKALLCVEGRAALYEYCAENDVAHRRLGKIIVAVTEAEIPVLEGYLRRAAENGVGDLAWLDAREVAALEPEVRCVRALLSPSTGIVDSHGLLLALERDVRRQRGHVVFRAPVVGGRFGDGNGIVVEVGGQSPERVRARIVINAAGLRAQAVARTLGLPAAAIPPCHYAKGHYFTLRGPSPFRRLVYPVAEAGGLGIHVTLDLAGRARFGPDVSWMSGGEIDYGFDEARAPAFYAAIRRYYPALPDGALDPGYTGIRPKLVPAGAPAADFVIEGPGDHGVAGLINLYGIESPGLTASLALADEVVRRLEA
jgi:L-2-hydroxyglutarate oxidase LhgO